MRHGKRRPAPGATGRHAETGLLSYGPEDLAWLLARLSGPVHQPGSRDYDSARLGFMHTYQPFPQLIVMARCESDVVHTLHFARKVGLRVAARSSGHSTAGFSGGDQIILDTGGLDHVRIDREARRAWVGAGTSFRQLNLMLDEARLHVPGGGCETVAVAGFMQGGGYGFTSRLFGMNCDCVHAVTMVLANGRVVRASAETEPDLFWAVRGGTGNQFGILTEIEYDLVALDKLTGFGLTWRLDTRAGVARAAEVIATVQGRFSTTGPEGLGLQVLMMRLPTPDDPEGQVPQLLLRGLFDGDRTQCAAVIEPLLALMEDREAQIEFWAHERYLRLNERLLTTVQGKDMPEVSMNTKPLVDSRIVTAHHGAESWLPLIDHFLKAPDQTSFLAMEIYGGAVNRPAPEDTAFVHRRDSLDLFAWSFWTFDDNGPAAQEWLEGFGRIAGGLSDDGRRYQNYPRRGNDGFRQDYFGANFPRLLRIRQAVDPHGLFDYAQSITPGPGTGQAKGSAQDPAPPQPAPAPRPAVTARGRLVGIYLDPPMAIARVGGSRHPVDAYRWEVHENPHRGVQTRIVPAPSLRPVLLGDDRHGAARLRVHMPQRITFKDRNGHVRPVAPFFALWARVQDRTSGAVTAHPVTPSLLAAHGLGLGDLRFTVTAANRKAEARTGSATCAAVARVVLTGRDYRRHALHAVSPHTQGEVPLLRHDSPLPLGHVQLFAPDEGSTDDGFGARLDQLRLRFIPGKGDSYGPPDAAHAPASPRPPGDFAPAQTEDGTIHAMTHPHNRFLSGGTPWSGYNFRTGNTPKWPTPMDSYDGARVGSGNGWGVLDDTCDLVIEARLLAQGRVLAARARAFAGPPDFAPDKRPFYSIRDELEDRDLPAAPLDRDGTPTVILDLFRRIFETASLINLDQRRAWALSGNAGMLGAAKDDPDWDAGAMPHIGPRSMRESDAPFAEVTADYTPGQGDTVAPMSGPGDRLPYTMVVQQVHARMADSPILREFLARRPDRVRRLVRPPFARLADLPHRPGLAEPAAVPMARVPQDGLGPVRYRDPRSLKDQTYDMRMPPYMRHSMGVPLSITRRHYTLLMAYLDRLESDPAWRMATCEADSSAVGAGKEAGHD